MNLERNLEAHLDIFETFLDVLRTCLEVLETCLESLETRLERLNIHLEVLKSLETLPVYSWSAVRKTIPFRRFVLAKD